MVKKSDDLIEDIEHTREALAEKLVTLETQIRDTVETARNTVEEKFENIKGTFRKINPKTQIEEHPLWMLGGSVALGVVAGAIIARKIDVVGPSGFEGGMGSDIAAAPRPVRERKASPSFLSQQLPSLWHKVQDSFGDEIQMAKGMLAAGAVNFVGDFVKRTFPQFSDQIEELCQSALGKVDPNRSPRDKSEFESAAGRRTSEMSSGGHSA